MVKLLQLIKEVFQKRQKPKRLISSNTLTDDEYKEVMFFENKIWEDVTCKQLEIYYDVIYFFSPEAFCYYLPGILSAGIKEDKTNLLVYDSIINMLDRSPNIAYWDNFFIKRWTLLTKQECEVIQEWLLWVESMDSMNYNDNTFSRAFDTLELLKKS